MNFPLEEGVCRTALSLFRNISANDALKTRLLNEGGLRLVLGCMSEHKDDKALQVSQQLRRLRLLPFSSVYVVVVLLGVCILLDYCT